MSFKHGAGPTLAALAILALGVGARAQVYDSGPPNTINGNEMTIAIQANTFSFTAPTTVNAVRFWDDEASGAYSGSINYYFYADSGGSPGALLASGTVTPTHVANGAITQNLPQFQDDFAVSPTAFGAGTYWLGLHNGPLTNNGRSDFYWADTNNNSPAGQEKLAPFTGAWRSNSTPHAFQLYGSNATLLTPETPSGLLLPCGLAPIALALAWKARKKTTPGAKSENSR